jgi:hypothetical protein
VTDGRYGVLVAVPGLAAAGLILDELISDARSAALVAAYVNSESVFAGELFDTLGTPDPCRVSIDDLLAVSLLDVRFGPLPVRTILVARADAISACLEAINPQVEIWEATDDLLDGVLTDLWVLLRSVPGMGPVKTSKLLARKRPHLVPILDSVITRVLGIEYKDSWRVIRGLLADRERRARLAALRPGNSGLSVLRLLDVLLWMHGSESTSARQTRASLGMPVQPRNS